MNVTLIRNIAAPPDVVFNTVADISQYAKAVRQIIRVEFLSETKTGVGTRFRETRMLAGREAATELEVTEFSPNERVRLVADSHGTVWDTVFTVTAQQGQTELIAVMEGRAYRLLPKVMNWLIGGMVKKAVAKDMDLVKAYCERAAG
ncbi:SRPBCC family protein [Exilibacterium tricleocarpae]|uniref:SRPBCC family protein n=1 Tax=Exilibacterium tricleocarpae TaxID=2591008 RepID=A0A545SY44_9GAMM|nr:SRPBCC family protein [Exilibacterium tricleocarpae]TQV69882.1 SRPBCC family protein [Exilibacterium tricleocarpae]